MRQAPPSNTSPGSIEAKVKASVARKAPPGAPEVTSPMTRPRRRSGAYSATRVSAPASSAPAPKPWTKRNRISRIGAATPIASAVGRSPIPTVAMPMSTMVRIIAGFRPTRSPRWEMMRPPSGRTTKPTAKVAKASIEADAGMTSGKKSGPITRPAAAP